MAKRFILVLVIVAALIGGLGFVKYRQVETAIAMGASFAPPPTAVTTVVAKRETWPTTLEVIGTAAAIQGVTVSADLPGTVDKIHFDSGQSVKEGDNERIMQFAGPMACLLAGVGSATLIGRLTVGGTGQSRGYLQVGV
jgi:multidrug efflux pump subunit AcrA (membrane-fusion protein)